MAGSNCDREGSAPPDAPTPPAIRVYLCYEPELRLCAERIDAWPWTNADIDFYDRRVEHSADSPRADSHKASLQPMIEAADVVICLISATSRDESWIAWELEVAKTLSPRRGLVGILLKDYVEPPAALKNSGAMFVPFRRDAVEAAVAWAASAREPSTEDFTLSEE